MIAEEFLPHIDGSAEIDAVVPEIQQADPFDKGQRGVLMILQQGNLRIRQQPCPLQIGIVGGLRGRIASQTDVLAPIGQGRAEISASVFFSRGIDALQMGILLCCVII